MPEPIFSGSSWPLSILDKMVRAHLRNTSSTFSPVRALVSRNISSAPARQGERHGAQGADVSAITRKGESMPRRDGENATDASNHHAAGAPATSRRPAKALTVILSELGRLQERHLPVRLQVLLVAHQDNDNVRAGKGPRVRQPVCQGVVRLAARDIVHQEGPGRPTVVATRNGPAPEGSMGVP